MAMNCLAVATGNSLSLVHTISVDCHQDYLFITCIFQKVYNTPFVDGFNAPFADRFNFEDQFKKFIYNINIL